MKFSTRLFLLSFLPNIFASVIYLYLAISFDNSFPILYVVISMVFTFVSAGAIIKLFSLPIDRVLSDNKNNKMVSKKRIQEVKRVHYLLSSKIPGIMVLFITVSFYVINVLMGYGLLFIFQLRLFLEFGHIIAIFSSSFIVQGFIFDNEIGSVRERLNITSIEGEKIFPIRSRLLKLNFSIVLSVGLIFLTYYTDATMQTVLEIENTNALGQYTYLDRMSDKIKLLENVITSEKENFKIAYNDILTLENRLKILKENPDADKLLILRDDLFPLKRESRFFKKMRTKIDQTLSFFFKALLFLLLLNFFIIKIFSQGITNQMNVINAKIAETLKRKKVKYEALPLISMTEVSYLTDNFNRLLKKLSDQNLELEEFYHTLEQRVLKKTEELRNSEDRLRGIINSMSDWIWEVDSKGRYTFCSDRVEKVIGYSPDEMIGKTPFEFMAQDEAERVGEIFTNIMNKKEPIKDMENWNITKEGELVCLLTNGVPIFRQDGEFQGFLGVDSDITNRKIAEEEREKLIKELQDALERVKTLDGLVPICSNCKKIRDDKGYWNQLESYIEKHSDAAFSHGICPECSEDLYGNKSWYIQMKKTQKKDL